jgi:hypothetical protein
MGLTHLFARALYSSPEQLISRVDTAAIYCIAADYDCINGRFLSSPFHFPFASLAQASGSEQNEGEAVRESEANKEEQRRSCAKTRQDSKTAQQVSSKSIFRRTMCQDVDFRTGSKISPTAGPIDGEVKRFLRRRTCTTN